MAVNITLVKTSSNGVWQGDNPLDFAFPLLILQTTLILAVCRLLAVFLKPLRQPQVIAEMLGGILLGPSVLGRNEEYMHRIFPKWSGPILESVAGFGLLFFLFLVGLELDLSSLRRSGWRAAAIAAAGISLTFVLGVGVALVFREAVDGADAVGFAQFLLFMAVALSITAFPVLARVLAELKLLTTRVGETAMAAAALNDVAAWISLALAVALAGNGGEGKRKSPLISIWVLLSGVVFVAFMMAVVKPAMKWVERRCSSRQGTVEEEAYMCLTLGGVLAAGFVTDLIGLHAIFGAFVFGLTIPKGGDLAARSTARIEDFVTGLLLPLYFASSGLKTDVTKISGAEAWGLLALVIAAACGGKIVGTYVAARMCMIPAREAITLGVLMNTKGLVELIVLNIGREKKVLNDEAFAILVLMALFTTFLTTPAVITIYQPARASSSAAANHRHRPGEFRILACVHGPANIPSLLRLTESTRSAHKSSRLKLYVMHLVQLTERSSSIIMLLRLTKNGFPLTNRLRGAGTHLADRVAAAFQTYSNLGRVSVRPATAISALASMHEDIRHVAEEKAAEMIVLPFHKQWRKINGEDAVEETSVGHGWSEVNQRVLKVAPCTVAVLVDRGYGAAATSTAVQNVGVLLFGGVDDGEALALGGRMVEHPAVKLAVVRFINNGGNITPPELKENDDGAVAEFINRMEGRLELIDKTATKIVDEVIAIGRDGGYDLIIVGKGWPCASTVAAAPMLDHPELGLIGNVLASSCQSVTASVLVVHRRNEEELSVSKSPMGEDGGGHGHDQKSNLV